MSIRPVLTAAFWFWILAICAPVAACVLAASNFPPGVDIPLQWGFDGKVNSWGSPWTMVPFGIIMAGVNLLQAFCFVRSDMSYSLGFVHGVSRKNTRPLLCASAVFVDVVLVAIIVYWAQRALPYVS